MTVAPLVIRLFRETAQLSCLLRHAADTEVVIGKDNELFNHLIHKPHPEGGKLKQTITVTKYIANNTKIV